MVATIKPAAKLVLTFILVLVLIPSAVLAQANLTVKTWGGAFNDQGTAVATDSNGNSYLAGTTESFGSGGSDIFLVKYNASNSLVWQRTWGGRLDDYPADIAVDSAGDSYVTGYSYSFNANGSAVLLKFNSSGGLVWQKNWGGGVGVSAIPGGGVYAVGEVSNGSSYYTHVLVERFDAAGNLAWDRSWSGPYRDLVNGLASDSAGNLYVVGETDAVTGTHGVVSQYAFLLKLGEYGSFALQQAWYSGVPSTPSDAADDIAVDSTGNIYVAGRTTVAETSQIGGYPYTINIPRTFVAKFNATGRLLWEKAWSVDFAMPSRIGLDASGNVYVSGATFGSVYPLGYILEISPTGALLAQQDLEGGSSGYSLGRGYYLAKNFTYNLYLASSISSSQPLLLCNPRGTLSNTTMTLQNDTYPLWYPSVAPSSLTGNVTTPAGSESYAGASDAALITYNPLSVGAIPACSSLAVSSTLYLVVLLLLAPVVRVSRKRSRTTI